MMRGLKGIYFLWRMSLGRCMGGDNEVIRIRFLVFVGSGTLRFPLPSSSDCTSVSELFFEFPYPDQALSSGLFRLRLKVKKPA